MANKNFLYAAILFLFILAIVVYILSNKSNNTTGGSSGGSGSNNIPPRKLYKTTPWIINTLDGKMPTCGKGTVTQSRRCTELDTGNTVDVKFCREAANDPTLSFSKEFVIDKKCPTFARYIRFERVMKPPGAADTDIHVHITVLEAFDTLGQKLTKPGMVVTAGGFRVGEEPEKVLDGDLNTWWHSDWDKPILSSQWIMIDLGAQMEIAKVRVGNRQNIPRRIVGTVLKLLKGPNLTSDVVYTSDVIMQEFPVDMYFDTTYTKVIEIAPN